MSYGTFFMLTMGYFLYKMYYRIENFPNSMGLIAPFNESKIDLFRDHNQPFE